VDVTATIAVRSYVGRRGGPILADASTTVADVDMGEDPMHAIYGALRIENLATDQPAYIPGQMPAGANILVNRSATTLCIPTNRFFPEFHTVGTMQAWIERLGDDKTIPGMPPLFARDEAGRYAVGGSIVVTNPHFPDHQWPPDAELPWRWELFFDTSQFPLGLYRVYMQYQRGFTEGHGEQVIQVASADFEMN
jgi:hypothetical protein